MKAMLLLIAALIAVAIGKSIHVVDHVSPPAPKATPEYQIGVAKADITGPAAEVGMMGYAMPGQRTSGIHTRLWARAYVIYHPATKTYAAFVNGDVCMIMQSVKLTVIVELAKIFGPDMFTNDNVLLTGIHTHSGPGAFSWYMLYDISDLGFDKESFQAVVDGIVQAIVTAKNNLKPASLLINTDSSLYGSNINRSPTAYLANPAEERAMYPEGDTDKNMTLVKIVDANGEAFGSIAWFAVHCTSMNNSNHLISSDNKGYAEYLFEKHMADNSSIMFKDIPFVAAFAQSNEGDVSPNTRGPHCPDGTPCADDSTCNGKNEHCIASGPGINMVDSTKIIGTMQFNHALNMFENAQTVISGRINYRHMFVNMSEVIVSGNFTNNGQPNNTCRAAMGYSFAAGTTDGPGAFDFKQGDNSSGNPFWNFISSFLAVPTEEQKKCQAPKPILIDVGLIKPLPWVPEIVPCQIITIGQLVLVAVPGEFTTMSGRRLRSTIKQIMIKGGMVDPIVVIAGLSNTYTGYITTFEEFGVQRYEGASTIFGPHTLGAYQTIFSQLAESIISGSTLPVGPIPRNLTEEQIYFNPPNIVDTAGGKGFGSIQTDVKSSYTVGQVAQAVFWGANPRNNVMHGQSFFSVEQLDPASQKWNTVLTDADWDTTFAHARHSLAESLLTCTWNITSATSGKYRFAHFGNAKKDPLSSKLTPYSGYSSVFAVMN